MNNIVNRGKAELVAAICEVLNEHGLQDRDFGGANVAYSPESNFGRALSYMPVENLKKMLGCSIEDWSEFDKVHSAWGRVGALRFEPYMVQSSTTYSLVIRYNRYLHVFRGMYFQVSGTIDGSGDYGSGAYRIDFLTKAKYGYDVMTKGLISYMLWWAAMIDASFMYQNLRELFTTNKTVLEDFLRSSMKCYHYDGDYRWSDIEPYIVYSNGSIDKTSRTMYQLCDGNNVFAYLSIGKKTVQVQVAGERLLTITIPEPHVGTKYSLDDEDDIEYIEEQVDVLEDNHYAEMLAVMALSLMGIKINFYNWYRLSTDIEPMMWINAPGVVHVKSLNDIYGCVPDEF